MSGPSLPRRGLLAAVGTGALAGCLTAPTDDVDQGELQVDIENQANTSRTVTLSFLGGEQAGPEPFGGVTVVAADGSESTVEADSLDEIPRERLTEAVSFTPSVAEPVKYYPDIASSANLTDTLQVDAETSWAVYVIADPSAEEPLLSYGQVTCAPGGFVGFSTVMTPDSTTVSVSCRGD